jgi:hypothetical protein
LERIEMPTADVHKQLPNFLGWLADAPMFIDAIQVNRFYDAIVAPESSPGPTTIEFTEESAREIVAALKLEAGLKPGQIVRLLKPLFSIDVKSSIEGRGKGAKKQGTNQTVTLNPITTPQRQLVQLALHYLAYQPTRLAWVTKVSEPAWRDAREILMVPRKLVFLDLPSQAEAESQNVPMTRLIPTAVEFADGKVELLYPKLKTDKSENPPDYPERAAGGKTLAQLRKEYWQWYDKHFSATLSMRVIEEAASTAGKRVQWIDYRVPVTTDGESLHLHVAPAGAYETGVFAYNFVKRGFKHGVRLVGTLKSEPDMNVLAIYEK